MYTTDKLVAGDGVREENGNNVLVKKQQKVSARLSVLSN